MKTRVLSSRILFMLFILLAPIANAATINVIYINGIQNTLEDAAETTAQIRLLLTASQNHIGVARKVFSVRSVWNPIGWNGTTDGSDLAQDKMELFLLKTAEEKFAADIRLIFAPHNQSRVVDKAAAARVSAFLDDMTPGDNSLESRGKITDVNMARTQLTIRTAIAVVQRLQSAVVVGHSQGNLLANLVFASLAASQGNDIYKSLRIVNIANTSAFAVSGLNFTHAGDAAIFSSATATALPDQSLETLPSRGSNWTRTTPSCPNNGACNFTMAAATFSRPTSNIPNQSAVDESLDHSIVETYLSTATVPAIDDQGISYTTGAIRFVDRFEDFVYAAASSLEASQAAPSAVGSFNEQFSSASLDQAIWTSTIGPGGITVSGGIATFGAGSYATTQGKHIFSGQSIIIEARFAGTKSSGRDTNISLIDTETGDLIRIGDTSYFGWGLYIIAGGKYNLTGTNNSRGANTGGAVIETNGASVSSYKVIRFVIDGTSISVQRGDSQGLYTEVLQRTLGASMRGKSFYLMIGTGAPDGVYSPAAFDWITIATQ